MPTKRSQQILNVLRSARPLVTLLGDRAMRADAPADTVAGLPMLGTRGKTLHVGGIPAILVSPSCQADASSVVLHMHGGAYVAGGLLQARVLASHIAAASCRNVATFAYRLAPQYPYPAQLQDARTVYDRLLAMGYPPDRIALTGESAGGNLALALALQLKQEKLPMPACIALMSPWGDVQLTGDSYRELGDVDPTLSLASISQAAMDFVGGDEALLTDPMVSPIHAEFHGFPPVQIHVGTGELLLSDAEALLAAMRRDQVPTLVRWEGMCHVFQIFGFPESRLSMKAIGQFLAAHLPMPQEASEPR